MSIPFENGNAKVIMLILTHMCNLKCSYCYESQKNDAFNVMKVETAKKIIEEEIDSLGDEYDHVVIHFMGGEPFLRFDVIRTICEWIESKVWPIGIVLSTTSNGTMLNNYKEWLLEHRNLFKVVLSADGDKVMHDKNRSSSFSAIDFDFYKSTWPDGKVKMTISPDTVSEVSKGVIFLHKQGINRIEGNLALGPDIKWEEKHFKLYRNELRKLVKYYLDHPDFHPASMVNVDICKIIKSINWRKRCSCGVGLVCYDTDGFRYPCHLFSSVTLSKIKLEKFQSSGIVFSDIDSFVDKKCEKCAIRNCCPRCYGMNYIYSGSVASVPSVICHASQIEFFSTCSLLYQRLGRHQSIGNKHEVEVVLDHIKKIIQNK